MVPIVSYLIGTVGDPERWKWTFCHFPSRRCQTRVSSDCIVFGIPLPSMYCVSRIYAMQAASSPTRWTWGLRIMVWIGLLLLDKAMKQTQTMDKLNFLSVSQNNSPHFILQNENSKLSRYKELLTDKPDWHLAQVHSRNNHNHNIKHVFPFPIREVFKMHII